MGATVAGIVTMRQSQGSNIRVEEDTIPSARAKKVEGQILFHSMQFDM